MICRIIIIETTAAPHPVCKAAPRTPTRFHSPKLGLSKILQYGRTSELLDSIPTYVRTRGGCLFKTKKTSNPSWLLIRPKRASHHIHNLAQRRVRSHGGEEIRHGIFRTLAGEAEAVEGLADSGVVAGLPNFV